MGLFDFLSGKGFETKVQDAIQQISGMNLGVENLSAKVDGKFVTLSGEAASREAQAKVMEVFNQMVATDNTLNTIRVMEAPQQPEPEPADESTEEVYEVVSGDTLSAIALKYYGNAQEYMKIFEANRDILDNPDLIKVGQKLRIPKE
jgi:nucleoid-associated protein YgaU